MDKFSLARITSDEVQDDELIELGPRNQYQGQSQEFKLDSQKRTNNTEESKHNQKSFQNQDQKERPEGEDYKSENKVVKTLNSIDSKSNLRDGSETENVVKSKSKLLQSFERLKSLTKIKSRNAMKSLEQKVDFSKTKSKDTESLRNVETLNFSKTKSKDTESLRNVETLNNVQQNEQILNDTKTVSIKTSEVSPTSQDVGIQKNEVCIQNKCPLDCKTIANAQNEQEAVEKGRKVPVGEKAKTSTKKRCYLLRSKTREKIKSKSLSNLSESQEEDKEKKKKEAVTKTESRKKYCSKRSTSSQSPKRKKKKTPSPSPKRKKKCYGQKQTQTPEQGKSELAKEQKPEDLKLSEEKDDKQKEKVPVEKEDKQKEKKDDKKTKSQKKTRKCYYYRKRSKIDKKSGITPAQPVLSTSPQPQGISPVPTPEPSKLLTPESSTKFLSQEKPSSSPSILSRSVSAVQPSEEEAIPLIDVSSVTLVTSHETFPSSTITASRTTIPSTEGSHESITALESDKEIPYSSRSELYTPSDKVQEDQEVEEEVEITSPGTRKSCMMAGPPAFLCNEDYKFPEFRERLNFTQNRGPIPPCLQPVLGPCEGRRCTMLQGGERGQVCGVKYATVKITFFPEYTTYEVMRSTGKPPKCIPKCIEEVFVTKYEPKHPSPQDLKN